MMVQDFDALPGLVKMANDAAVKVTATSGHRQLHRAAIEVRAAALEVLAMYLQESLCKLTPNAACAFISTNVAAEFARRHTPNCNRFDLIAVIVSNL